MALGHCPWRRQTLLPVSGNEKGSPPRKALPPHRPPVAGAARGPSAGMPLGVESRPGPAWPAGADFSGNAVNTTRLCLADS